MKIIKCLLVLFLFALGSARSQTLSDSWILILQTREGSNFEYHSKSLVKNGTVPVSVTVNLRETDAVGRSSGYTRWEIDCRNRTITFPESQPISVLGERTNRAVILSIFCGISDGAQHWVAVGALLDTATRKISGFLFVDTTSTKFRTYNGKQAYELKTALGGINLASAPWKLEINEKGFLKVPCNSPDSQLGYRIEGSGAEEILPVNEGSLLAGLRGLVCRGFLTVAENPDPALTTDSAPIEEKIAKAKIKCKDLGFKSESEQFAECVLKLSR